MKIKILLSVLLCAALLLVSCGEKPADETSADTGADVGETVGGETGTTDPAATLDVSFMEKPLDHIQLAEYKGLPASVSEEEIKAAIDNEINSLLSANKQMEEIAGPSEKGDTLTVDFEGFVEGVRHENACAENQTITLGASNFIPGFEDALYGVSTGDEFAVDLTFPDNYYEELAGKPVQFKFTIHKIERNNTEYNDALVAAHTEFATVAEYEAQLREDIVFSYKLTALWEEVMTGSTMTLPASVVSYIDNYVVEGIAYYTSYAEQMSMTLEQFCESYLGTTVEQFKVDLRTDLEDSFKSELIFKAIAEKEGIQLTEDIYVERMQLYLDMYGFATIADMEAEHGKEVLETSILRDMVYELIVDSSVEA